ncbi:tetratricopeptide repeat protein [Aquimarina sp. RZ0]|nr:tetratricopeptide repeat protein [Aquimarina sp. RZ0]
MNKNSIKIKQVLFLSLFLIFNTSFSQTTKIVDSLITVLKVKTLSKKERSKSLSLLAFNHQDLDTALFLAKQSLKIAAEIKDPLLQGNALEEISHVERRLGNNSKSFEASLKALKIYESLKLIEHQSASYAQLASNYISDKEYKMAILYLKKSLDIYSNSDNLKNYAITTLNLGEAYRLAGHLDSATTCFRQTIKYNDQIKNELISGYSLGNLGMVYAAQNEFGIAKKSLDTAILTLGKLGDLYSTSIYLAELGEIYSKQKKPELAEKKYLEAMKMAKEAGLKEQIRDFSAILRSFYEERQAYEKALLYQKMFQTYQDSLVNKENIQKIEQLKSGYEIDKRESKIALLNTINTNQKFAVVSLIIGVIILLLFAYLLYRINKKIKRTNIILSDQKEIITKREQEKALLLRELNHRVKNNLQMISSLLNLQSHELTGHPAKDAIVSGKYRVEALSLVHRKLYQEGVDTKIMMKEYLEELVLGLFHGYDAKFNPHFDIINIGIHVDVAIPLALIINELVTNSLKYAYKKTKHPTLQIIVLKEVEDYLHIQIIDNGIGFDIKKSGENNSFGIKLITSLVEQLEGVIIQKNSKGTHWDINLKIT